MARAKQTQYKVIHEDKYSGNASSVVCRSSWERHVARHLDGNEAVRRWNSEEVVVPYVSPVDGERHRYFVDFFVELSDGGKFMVEVKPEAETKPPVLPKSGIKTKGYKEAVRTYVVNVAKWNAAKEYADKNGMVFQIWTERELRQIGRTRF